MSLPAHSRATAIKFTTAFRFSTASTSMADSQKSAASANLLAPKET